MMKFGIGWLGALLVLLGCASPEATRARGGGPGGDIGNRGETVEMHAGADPYHKTPQLIGNHGETGEDAGRQANRK